jgi:hypothetical protein
MPPNTGAAQLFVDKNYAGASVTLDVGNFNIQPLGQADAEGDTSASSILVAPGYTVTVFTGSDFTGDSTTFTADAPDIGAFDDKILSAQVRRTVQARMKAMDVRGLESVLKTYDYPLQ